MKVAAPARYLLPTHRSPAAERPRGRTGSAGRTAQGRIVRGDWDRATFSSWDRDTFSGWDRDTFSD